MNKLLKYKDNDNLSNIVKKLKIINKIKMFYFIDKYKCNIPKLHNILYQDNKLQIGGNSNLIGEINDLYYYLYNDLLNNNKKFNKEYELFNDRKKEIIELMDRFSQKKKDNDSKINEIIKLNTNIKILDELNKENEIVKLNKKKEINVISKIIEDVNKNLINEESKIKEEKNKNEKKKNEKKLQKDEDKKKLQNDNIALKTQLENNENIRNSEKNKIIGIPNIHNIYNYNKISILLTFILSLGLNPLETELIFNYLNKNKLFNLDDHVQTCENKINKYINNFDKISFINYNFLENMNNIYLNIK